MSYKKLDKNLNNKKLLEPEVQVAINQIKNLVDNLVSQEIYVSIDISEIEDSIKKPNEYCYTTDDFIAKGLREIDDLIEDLSKLYDKLTKLQDLL